MPYAGLDHWITRCPDDDLGSAPESRADEIAAAFEAGTLTRAEYERALEEIRR